MTGERKPMKWDTKEPCPSCPYRKDAPLELWHPEEFENLLANDRDELSGAVFGCHKTRLREEQSVCAGWLVNQRERGVPSIQLRLKLMTNEDALKAYEEVSDGGHELYGSIEEMCSANRVFIAKKRSRS